MLASGALGYVLLGVGGTWEIVVGTILALDGLEMGRRVLLRHRSVEPGIPGAATGLVQTGDFAGSLLGPVLFGTWPPTTAIGRRGSLPQVASPRLGANIAEAQIAADVRVRQPRLSTRGGATTRLRGDERTLVC